MNRNLVLGGLAGAAAVYALSSEQRRSSLKQHACSLIDRANGMMRSPVTGPVSGEATSHISSFQRFHMPSKSTMASLAGAGLALYGGMKKRHVLGRVASMAGAGLLNRYRYRHVS